MKKWLRILLIFLLVIFIIIQFFHPAKNASSDISVYKNDISTIYIIPDSVHQILKTSCYDCHSNNTQYPWYNNIQPVAWWLSHHVKEGKRALNFSEFASYSIRKKYKKLDGLIKEIQSSKMPLSSYTLIHRYAILTPDQKDELVNWATTIMDSIKANTPADSLLKK
jgi:Haem-binding domain